MEYKKDEAVVDSNPANRDPITKEPGSHPVGTGVGAAGGAVAGAAAGAVVGGPVGAVVGGAIGAVVGGGAGHAAGEAVNPTVESEYWSKNYKNRPYYKSGKEYSEYEPAYKLGWESATRKEYAEKKFEDVEPELERRWSADPGARGPWSDSREATRDAWSRVRGN
jgi:phage tail tape-measure protein